MSNSVPSVIFFDLNDTLINSRGQLYSDVLDTIQILHERGYRLGLISNWYPATVAEVYASLNNLGLALYIEYDLVTIPSEVPGNIPKPQKPIFDKALEKAGHPNASSQSIFVTETLDHIQKARTYGWRAILKRDTGICQPGDGECVVGLVGLLDLLPDLGSVTGTNLHLAPHPKKVDGLWAVPIDISRISGKLIFDGQTSSATGDVTIEFRTGRHTGNPIFDLRQTITAAWLDGISLPVSKIAFHDFGGGPDAQVRVVEKVVDATSLHTLRLTYTIGQPRSPPGGQYLPQIEWTTGPRLNFNFGFTDLAPARYLEAWIPANLIYDQYEINLEIEIMNTTITHTLITNGTSTQIGLNHWTVVFPSRFSALSPLLKIHPSDSLTSLTSSVTLPVSCKTVLIEAWKFKTNPLNLSTEINFLKTWLTENENSIGPYIHGNRFVAFLHIGGMEYEGGTTSDSGNLRHETFHSWWARGVKPASQPDAWADEGLAEYHDAGSSTSIPFNFSSQPVKLCSRNFWERSTADNAYTAGELFWDGIAALIGVTTLNSLLSEYYKSNRGNFYTTSSLEEFLLSKTGNTQIVDAFHRFAYGFSDVSPSPDLWIRDAPAHGGADLWSGVFWNSPDLWVRNSDDGGLTHQNPEYSQDNWIYARVRNRGSSTASHFVVTFNVKQFAGTQFYYPNDFLPCVAAASGFDLAPGASMIVKARWPRNLVPPPGAHACLLAAVLTRGDHPTIGRHVWEHNNLAQKNLTIVDLLPNAWIVLPFVVSNLQSLEAKNFSLELIRPKDHIYLEASLLHRSKTVFKQIKGLKFKKFDFLPSPMIDNSETRLDCGGHVYSHVKNQEVHMKEILTSERPESLARQFERGVEAFFTSGTTAHIPILVQPQGQLMFGLKLKVPKNAKSGETLHLDLIQRDTKIKRILGGIAIKINVT